VDHLMKNNQENASHLPLAGVKVLDFGHTVMAPTCGLILADLGATVVRIERVEGDPTRSLTGFGSGFFGYLNRNKESVAVDLKNPQSRAVLEAAIEWADVLLRLRRGEPPEPGPGVLLAEGIPARSV
jgi:crotonobetainyl-CoA:carnitine CoA-transferase CaiB-like acyl-CoA transferase